MRPFWMFPLLLSANTFAQNTINIEVLNVPSNEGKISAALYDNDDSFLKFESVYASASSTAMKGRTEVVFTNIPEGTYAVALFHDKNDNDKLDTNWMGIPKEKVAFSNAKMKVFGPPSFQECTFNLEADTKISIAF